MKGTGYISSLLIVVMVSILLFFGAALMFGDANNSGKFSGVDLPASLNTTSEYASNLQNQTNSISEKLRNSESTSLDPVALLNLTIAGGASAVTAFMGMIGIALAIAFDMGAFLMIPALAVSLLVIGILFFVAIQVIEGYRMGRI